MILKNLFAQFRRGVQNMFKGRSQRAYEALDTGMNIFMAKVKQNQPVGKLDPLVQQGYSSRNIRPSRRQGHTPVEEGWSWEVQKTERGATATLVTTSPHIKFFTKWVTGGQLGTREHGIHKKDKLLHFWWRGKPRLWENVGSQNFLVQEDFMQKSYDEAKGQMSDIARDAIRTLVVESRVEL